MVVGTEHIAKIIYAAFRGIVPTAPAYASLPSTLQDDIVRDVESVLIDPTLTAPQVYTNRVNTNIAAGWIYGLQYDPIKKTDPLLIDFFALPEDKQLQYRVLIKAAQTLKPTFSAGGAPTEVDDIDPTYIKQTYDEPGVHVFRPHSNGVVKLHLKGGSGTDGAALTGGVGGTHSSFGSYVVGGGGGGSSGRDVKIWRGTALLLGIITNYTIENAKGGNGVCTIGGSERHYFDYNIKAGRISMNSKIFRSDAVNPKQGSWPAWDRVTATPLTLNNTTTDIYPMFAYPHTYAGDRPVNGCLGDIPSYTSSFLVNNGLAATVPNIDPNLGGVMAKSGITPILFAQAGLTGSGNSNTVEPGFLTSNGSAWWGEKEVVPGLGVYGSNYEIIQWTWANDGSVTSVIIPGAQGAGGAGGTLDAESVPVYVGGEYRVIVGEPDGVVEVSYQPDYEIEDPLTIPLTIDDSNIDGEDGLGSGGGLGGDGAIIPVGITDDMLALADFDWFTERAKSILRNVTGRVQARKGSVVDQINNLPDPAAGEPSEVPNPGFAPYMGIRGSLETPFYADADIDDFDGRMGA